MHGRANYVTVCVFVCITVYLAPILYILKLATVFPAGQPGLQIFFRTPSAKRCADSHSVKSTV